MTQTPTWSRRKAIRALGLGSLSGLAGATGVAAAKQGKTRVSTAVASAPAVTLLAGEPTAGSIVLQARFASALIPPGDLSKTSPGVAGSACFEVANGTDFAGARRTAWLPVADAADFIARTVVDGLKPGTRYHYRAVFKDDRGHAVTDHQHGSFLTLRAADDRTSVSFALFSCFSYELFYRLGTDFMPKPWSKAATGVARERGYPSMDLMRKLNANFLVATGDTVYYDHPFSEPQLWAKTAPQMRAKWHCQLSLPAVREAFAAHPVYFQMDDHDFRFDDGDNTGDKLPTPADGRNVFREQVPLVTASGLAYRTHRINRHLQIWLLDSRDYRSANESPDGPDKTMWGSAQREWLEKTLLESTADFKIIVNPTPMVGPDDDRKADNQTSHKGFGTEGDGFFDFLKRHALTTSTFIMNGDRHWKYHSIHPTGVEEFCCGTGHIQNSRYGVAPGDPMSTDPEARIRQPYLQPVPDGGFLQVDVEPDVDGDKATMLVRFWSETGRLQYAVRRFGKRKLERPGRPDKKA